MNPPQTNLEIKVSDRDDYDSNMDVQYKQMTDDVEQDQAKVIYLNCKC